MPRTKRTNSKARPEVAVLQSFMWGLRRRSPFSSIEVAAIDILLAVARREAKGGVHGMGISELRREAYNKGLNIGGSREMLIAILGYAG